MTLIPRSVSPPPPPRSLFGHLADKYSALKRNQIVQTRLFVISLTHAPLGLRFDDAFLRVCLFRDRRLLIMPPLVSWNVPDFAACWSKTQWTVRSVSII